MSFRWESAAEDTSYFLKAAMPLGRIQSYEQSYVLFPLLPPCRWVRAVSGKIFGCWQTVYARHVELSVEDTNSHAELASIQVKENKKTLFLQIY